MYFKRFIYEIIYENKLKEKKITSVGHFYKTSLYGVIFREFKKKHFHVKTLFLDSAKNAFTSEHFSKKTRP